jgi:hypothetical protein
VRLTLAVADRDAVTDAIDDRVSVAVRVTMPVAVA